MVDTSALIIGKMGQLCSDYSERGISQLVLCYVLLNTVFYYVQAKPIMMHFPLNGI